MDIQSCFKIGYISKGRGLSGEVTVLFSEAIDAQETDSLFVEINGALVPYVIESISSRPDKSFIKFEDIDTIEAANQLKGCSLYLPKTIRPDLKRGEFYNDEVVGFKVEDDTHGLLGVVKDVVQSGPNRLIEITYGQKEILIPVNGPFIKSINRSKKIIKVDLPDGFLDI
jgi:16S rRNA processing protein RimM